MNKQRAIEVAVGIFIIIAILCLIFLAIRVSGLTDSSYSNTYKVTADFENIGDLKNRSPVRIAGVSIGKITDIELNSQTYQAVVTMEIAGKDKIPLDSTANIYTSGLIGSNYISITPGFSEQYLKNGGVIARTNQALILQNVIGQLLFSMKNSSSKSDTEAATATPAATTIPPAVTTGGTP